MIPVAKSFVWRRDADELLIVFDPRECLRIPDPIGQVEQLLATQAATSRGAGSEHTTLEAAEPWGYSIMAQ